MWFSLRFALHPYIFGFCAVNFCFVLPCKWPEIARWWTVMFWAQRAQFLVVHDAPLGMLQVPVATTAAKSDSFIDLAAGATASTRTLSPSESCDDSASGSYCTVLGLFADARIFKSWHCLGPATMVATMKPGRKVALPKDIYGYCPHGEAVCAMS